MRYLAIISFLSTLSTLTSAAAIRRRTAATPNAPELERRSPNPGPIIMKPINLDIFHTIHNLEVRSDVDFSRLDLSTQSQLIFGAVGDNGNILLANMTLFAPNGQQIVMMESFETLTSAVDCNGNDGTMSLTFSSKEAFDAAVSKWSVINDKEEDTFLMIANHDGCTTADQTQPYTISNVRNDEATLMTILAAKPAAWGEVAGTFDLDFGSAKLAPSSSDGTLSTLGLGDFFRKIGDGVKKIGDQIKDGAEEVGDQIKDGAEEVGDKIEDGVSDIIDKFKDIGDAGGDKEITIPISIGDEGKRVNILSDPSINLDCTSCFIKGDLRLQGRLSVDNFVIKVLTLSANPRSVRSRLEIEATLIKSTQGPKLSKEIASVPIPIAGLLVPEIFQLGGIITYEVAVETVLGGSLNFTFGQELKLSDDARIDLDLVDPSKSRVDGFGGITPDSSFNVNSGEGHITISAISRPKITFGVEVLHVGKLEAGLNLGLPSVSTTFTAAFDEAGACEKSSEAKKTGIKINSEVAMTLDFSVNGKFGPGGILNPGELFSQNLLKFAFPLVNKCFPMDIPGLGSS